MLRKFIDYNVKTSRWFDGFMPHDMNVQGNQAFQDDVAAPYIRQNDITVYDLGGGSRPYISADHKKTHNQTIYGLDIDADELKAAPKGGYDDIIVADLTRYDGKGDADLIICQAALEHVPDNDGSFRAMASILKSGGVACVFTPSRNALFARLNMILPQEVKKKILYALFPRKAEGHDGFKAYYDQCTPKEFRKLAHDNGLEVIELRTYYKSTYFEICFPLYIIWRMWQILFRALCSENAAETFTVVLRKK